MNLPMTAPHPQPWIERFRADPAAQLDDLLRGLARIPPYERATPSEILKRLFGALPEGDADVRLLDEALRDWLEKRWREWGGEQRKDYGMPRFVTEYMDALSVVWLLNLPECGAWLQRHYFELAQWAIPLRLSKVWDLTRALAQAAALSQRDAGLRFYWLRLCAEAAQPSRRAMLDPALSGLSRLPNAKGHGASPDLIGGLARFGAGLQPTPRDQADFLRRWRSLKVRFPRTSNTWHKLWHGALTDSRYQDKPFREWLLASEAFLKREWKGPVPVQIPPSVLSIVNDLNWRGRQENQREKVLREAVDLMGLLERYAEATGDAYFLVRSTCNLGKELVAWAPGHALAWSREALRWEPSNGLAWDLRGRALVRLGRHDLAEAVYWEAARRLPDNAVLRNQLGLLLQAQDRMTEAEALFREAHAVDSKNAVARVELAQLLALTGRAAEAEQRLRQDIIDLPDNRIIPYTLASLLIAWDRPSEVREIRDGYAQNFGRDHWIATLDRLLAAGAAGAEEERQHLALRRPGEEDSAPQIQADQPSAARQTDTEQQGHAALRHAAQSSHADLLFRIGQADAAADTLTERLRADSDDLYARVVWALHDPAQRLEAAARYREQLGALAPHLAAAGPDTPAPHWQRLLSEFPERAPLIHLTRHLRGTADEATDQRLDDWLRGGEAGGDAYLHKQLRQARENDGILPQNPDLQALLNAAIRREVELLDPALDYAA